MDMGNFAEVNRCCYRVDVNIMVSNQGTMGQALFRLYVFRDDQLSDRIKLTLINLHNDEESYTCMLNRVKFEAMKFAQDLVIDYGDLIEQIRGLLSPRIHVCKLKLRIADEITLIFYTTSELRLLTLLEIPFLRTSNEEVTVNYRQHIVDMKRTIHVMEDTISEFEIENNQLRLKVADRNKMYQLAESYLDHINVMMPRIRDLERENMTIRQILNANSNEKFRALSQLTTYRVINGTQAEQIVEFKDDVSAMRNGISYYAKKIEILNLTVANLQDQLEDTVTAERYNELLGRYTSTLAELLEKNVRVDELGIERQEQQNENTVLQNKLEDCMATMRNLQGDTITIHSDTDEDNDDRFHFIVGEFIRLRRNESPAIVPEVAGPEEVVVAEESVVAEQSVVPEELVVPAVDVPDVVGPDVIIPQVMVPQVDSPQLFVPQVVSPQLKSPQVFVPQLYFPQEIPQIFSSPAMSPFLNRGYMDYVEDEIMPMNELPIVPDNEIAMAIRNLEEENYNFA